MSEDDEKIMSIFESMDESMVLGTMALEKIARFMSLNREYKDKLALAAEILDEAATDMGTHYNVSLSGMEKLYDALRTV